MSDEDLIRQARAILYKYGKKGAAAAKEAMQKESIPYAPLQEAVSYFMAGWEDVLHPALLCLACEAVGGDAEKTVPIAKAIVLLAGGADLHDDIIDGSEVKAGKPTVLGKYGKDLTVLAGETLLFKGLFELYDASEQLPKGQGLLALKLIKEAFFKLSSVEAKEVGLHRKLDVGNEYFEMIKTKSAITEATMRIGGIIGGATPLQIEILASYGKSLSVLSAIRDEFIDAYEIDEVLNRYKNECLPLPILLTLQDPVRGKEILALLSTEKLTDEQLQRILSLVSDSKETMGLEEYLHSVVNNEVKRVNALERHKKEFITLLQAMIVDL